MEVSKDLKFHLWERLERQKQIHYKHKRLIFKLIYVIHYPYYICSNIISKIYKAKIGFYYKALFVILIEKIVTGASLLVVVFLMFQIS